MLDWSLLACLCVGMLWILVLMGYEDLAKGIIVFSALGA